MPLTSSLWIRVRIADKSLPALVCSGFSVNILSAQWARERLSATALLLGDADNPNFCFPLSAFGYKVDQPLILTDLTDAAPCILGEPFISAFSPINIDVKHGFIIGGPNGWSKEFQQKEAVESWVSLTEKGVLPCEEFCLENHRCEPGSYMTPGLPRMPNENRIAAGVWANNTFFGLPGPLSHNLYAGAYTWEQIQWAFLEAYKDFSPYSQCTCALAKMFATKLPNLPTVTPFMGLNFAWRTPDKNYFCHTTMGLFEHIL